MAFDTQRADRPFRDRSGDASVPGDGADSDGSGRALDAVPGSVALGGSQAASSVPFLETAVRHAVIPKLYARRSEAEASRRDRVRGLTAGEILKADGSVDYMLRLVLSGQTEAQLAFLRDLHARAVPIRVLVEGLVVPVANEIGRAWVDDRMSFAEVTITIGRMQKTVSEFTAFLRDADVEGRAPLVLVAPAPGEQHTFGAAALGELLNETGLTAECRLDADAGELCRKASSSRYAAIALSCNSDRTLGQMGDLIGRLRDASCNRDVAIVIGGWALHPEDQSINKLGADLVVSDRSSAIDAIASLVAERR